MIEEGSRVIYARASCPVCLFGQAMRGERLTRGEVYTVDKLGQSSGGKTLVIIEGRFSTYHIEDFDEIEDAAVEEVKAIVAAPAEVLVDM